MSDFEAQMEKLIRPTISSQPKITTDDILIERAKTHGDYHLVAQVYQDIRRAISSGPQIFNDVQATGADMIAMKLARIACGDPNFRDHWDDVAGYAKLVADRCTK